MNYYCILTLVLCSLLCTSYADNEIGYFWHVTDFHYDHTYATSMLSCNDDVPKPGKYGDYWCDSPWTLVQDSIVSMSNIKPYVDFMLWTGSHSFHHCSLEAAVNFNVAKVFDFPKLIQAVNEPDIFHVQIRDSVAHIVDANLTLDLNLEIVENITESLNSSFPHVPVYASLGNHDFYPGNQAEYNESQIYVEVAKMWEDWISNQSQVEQFRLGGYYVARVAAKLRLLALNTNLYYTSNKLTKNVADPAGQMEWMSEQLKDARSKGDKVIVSGHVPPSMQTPGLADWFYPHHKTQFVNILLENADVIVATMFGHDHSDGFKIIQDKDEHKAVTQFTAPSVTPWRYRSSTKVYDAHNPGIRLVKYDRVTGRLIDYEQYYINLTDSNRQENTAWSRLYSFTQDYNVTDMSVASLRKIFSQMARDKGTDYADKYCTYSIVSNYRNNCTDAMRAEVYCGGLNFDLTEAQNCKQKYIDGVNGAFVSYLNLFTVVGAMLVQITYLMLQ